MCAAFQECNMLNPDSSESESDGEMFTKDNFDKLDNK